MIVAIEISKRAPDCWSVWTLERVRGAFSFGRGTPADLVRYMRENVHCCEWITDPADIAAFINSQEVKSA